MSLSVDRDVGASLQAAQTAHFRFGLAFQVMQAEAQRGDFEAVERERANLHALIDECVDQFAIANRRALDR